MKKSADIISRLISYRTSLSFFLSPFASHGLEEKKSEIEASERCVMCVYIYMASIGAMVNKQTSKQARNQADSEQKKAISKK